MNKRSNVISVYDTAMEERPRGKCAGYVFWDADKLSAREAERLKTFFDHCNLIAPTVFFNGDCSLAQYLSGKGIPVRFLSDYSQEAARKGILSGFKRVLLKIPFAKQFKSNWQFRNILKEYNLEFVQCYGKDAFEHYAFGAGASGLKVICYLEKLPALATSKIKYWRENLPLILSDKVLVGSMRQYEALEEQSRRLFISMQKEFSQHVAMVRSGVNLERYYPVDVIEILRLREKLGINFDAKVVVFLGEFASQNKQLEFLQQVCLKFAASASVKRGRRVEFRFAMRDTLPGDLTDAGDSKFSQSHSYLLKCCDLIDSLNLRNGIFLDAVGKEQRFLDLLRAADIAVLSPEVARNEESLAKILSLGKPIVTIDAWNQTAELIAEHGCGKACKSSDFNAVYEAVFEFVQNDILYKQSCNNAQMIARHSFDANYTVGEYEREMLSAY